MLYYAKLQFNYYHFLLKVVSTRKKKHQHKGQLSQLNEALNDFVTDTKTNASATAIETLELQTNDLPKNFGRITVGENSACQDQVLEKNVDNKIRRAGNIAVMTVEKRKNYTILTAMDNIVMPRNDIAVRSITG